MRLFNLARSVEVCVCVCVLPMCSEYSLRKYIKWNFQFNIDGVLLDFSSKLYIRLRDFDYFYFLFYGQYINGTAIQHYKLALQWYSIKMRKTIYHNKNTSVTRFNQTKQQQQAEKT